jgi:Rrf2 family protein
MNISSRCDYACRAIVQLAALPPDEATMTALCIAEKRNIPEKYLVHILLELKKAGLVTSVRGAQGGYRLAKKPTEITLLDIVLAVDGPIMSPPPCEDASSNDLAAAWKDASRDVEQVLSGITIQSIADRADKANMYFI